MTTATELKDHLLTRASEDGDFRARLLADSNATISAELDTPIPEYFHIKVHEDSATTAHLVLPRSGDLSEAEMESVAGGVGYADWNPFPPDG